MSNAKLMTTRIMKRLRINVLVSVCPSGSMPPLFPSIPALARGGSGRTFWTRGSLSRAVASGPRTNLILVTLAAGMLSLLLFQGVLPVILLISPRMILESCALKVGSPIGFPLGLVWEGVAAPLPLFPLPPLPRPGRLGNVVAGMLCPLEGTLRYINVDLMIGQSFAVDGRLYFLLWRLLRQG